MFKKLTNLLRSSERSQNSWVLRAPRVRLNLPEGIVFAPLEAKKLGLAEKIPVANISTTGIGFFREPEHHWPGVGARIPGSIVLRDQKYNLEVEIVRLSPSVAGCRYVGEITLFQKGLETYFDVELAALRMTQVSSMILKEEPDGTPHLFRGADSCELFCVESQGKIARFQVSIFGVYIEGGEGLKTRFGTLHSGDPREKPQHKGSSLVQLAAAPEREQIQLALRFLEQISGLDPNWRQSIRRLIESNSP